MRETRLKLLKHYSAESPVATVTRKLLVNKKREMIRILVIISTRPPIPTHVDIEGPIVLNVL